MCDWKCSHFLPLTETRETRELLTEKYIWKKFVLICRQKVKHFHRRDWLTDWQLFLSVIIIISAQISNSIFQPFIPFYCKPVYPLDMGRRGSCPSRTRNTSGIQQVQIVLFASHLNGTKRGRRCNNATLSLVDLWTALLLVKPAWPASLIFPESFRMAESS